MAQLTLDQTDIDRIEEVRSQFDPAEHLATAGLFEALRFEEREAALKFMREMIRDELYGALIWRTALEAYMTHRVVDFGPTAMQPFHDAWNDRYLNPANPEGPRAAWRHSVWGHNLGYMSQDLYTFATSVPNEAKDRLTQGLWILLDVAVVAVFGPVGNNHDEPSLADA